MLAVLCSAPRPPLGVALLGLTIVVLNWVLHLLPYIMFCGMIILSVWPPSHPLPPDVMYYPVNGHLNQVHMAYTRVGFQPSKEARSFELNTELRILIFLLAIPVTSVVESAFFRPARDMFIRTIECWFDMRYVHPAQTTGSWPGTWTPIFNALRSCEFAADFIDGAMGRNSGTSSVRAAGTHTSGPFAGIDAFSGSRSMQPAEQGAPSSPQCKRAPTPDPIVHNKPECPTNAPRTRKTFVSPPRVSPHSPWIANGTGGLSPVSKNLSRIVGVLFHYPPPHKPVIPCQINLMAKFPSAHVLSHVSERLWSMNEHSVPLAWASLSSLGTAVRNSPVPWHGGAELLRSPWGHDSNHLVEAVPELGENISGGSLSMGSRSLPGTCETLALKQTHLQQQYWEYAHSPHTSSPLPEPPVKMLPQDFVSERQHAQYFQPWSTQTPVHHGFPYQDQHMTTPPVSRQQPFHGFPLGLDSMALVQHGSHLYSDVPKRPMADQEPRAFPVLELPPFSSLPVAPQEQYTFQLLDRVPLFQFSEDVPQLEHGLLSAPPARPELPEMPHTTGRCANTAVFVPCTASQGGSSHSSSQSVPFDVPPETVSPNYTHQPPTLPLPVPQSRHILAQPFCGLNVTETFAFDVSRVIPYFDFSHRVPHPDGIELDAIPQATTAMSFPSDSHGVNDVWSPISASRECPLRLDPGVQIQQGYRDPASQPQEVVSNPLPHQPSARAEQTDSSTSDVWTPGAKTSTTGANMDVEGDDDTDSDSDSDMDSDSDSDSSEDDSDSDSDSDSKEDAVVTRTVRKTSSNAQDDVQGVPIKKNISAPAPVKDDGDHSDSDSDSEYIPTPTPPGASNDDDSSSSDEDMSDHEEEDRLYWDKFYTPRHRRQPDVSVSV